MKKLGVFFVMFFMVGSLMYSQETTTLFFPSTMTLDKAIQAAAKKIEDELPLNTRVAVLNFISSSEPLSNFVIDEIMDILTNDKKTGVVERSRIDAIRKERGYQLSGEVAEDEIKSIGNQAGAEYIITGSISYSGTSYRFRIYAINIENGIREASSSYTVRNNDPQLAYFLSGSGEREQAVRTRDSESWKNKWVYLSPFLGGGSSIYYDRYDGKQDIGVAVIGVQGQLQIFRYLALELDLGVGISEITIPLIPLLGELTFTFGRVEFNAGIGYTVGAGFTAEASLGLNLGPGILCGEFMYVDVGTLHENNKNGIAIVFLVGYKFGLGDKR